MFWSTDMRVCDRQTLVRFLRDQLEEDDRLDFLFHLDKCASCWGRCTMPRRRPIHSITKSPRSVHSNWRRNLSKWIVSEKNQVNTQKWLERPVSASREALVAVTVHLFC